MSRLSNFIGKGRSSLSSVVAVGATTALMLAGMAVVGVSPASAATFGAATTGFSTTNTTATLNGTVTADGTNAISAISFCYSRTSSDVTTCTSGTSVVASPANATNSASGQAESAAITGLIPHTTYYFNIKAVDATPATAYGTVLSFTTGGTAGTVTMTSVSPGVSSSVYGTSETLTATTGAGETGTVTFLYSLDSSTYQILGTCSGRPISGTTATCVTTAIPAGTVDLEAFYNGDTSYSDATSAAFPYTVSKASSGVVVSSVSPVSPVSYGTTVTMTATVTAGATGYVQFESSLNGVTYAAVTGCSAVAVSSSVATCATTTLPGGTVDLEALYLGDSNYFASTSVAYPYIVKNTGTVTVTVSPVSPTYYGNTVTITAAVTSGATGSVTFETSPNGSAWTPIVACTSVALSITTHTAVCTTTALPAGNAYLEAVYSGDAYYLTSTSAAFPYVVTQATQGVLTLNVSPRSGTVGKAVTLSTTGGTSTGAVTYSVTNGTARGCTVSGTSLKVASAGTCIVTATKAADTNFSAVSSAAVTVSFIQPYQVYRVYGAALTGRTVNVAMTGVGFFGRPTIRSSAPGTSTLVLKDHGNWMLVRVTVSRFTARGVHTFTVILPNGKAARVNYIQR